MGLEDTSISGDAKLTAPPSGTGRARYLGVIRLVFLLYGLHGVIDRVMHHRDIDHAMRTWPCNSGGDGCLGSYGIPIRYGIGVSVLNPKKHNAGDQ